MLARDDRTLLVQDSQNHEGLQGGGVAEQPEVGVNEAEARLYQRQEISEWLPREMICNPALVKKVRWRPILDPLSSTHPPIPQQWPSAHEKT